MKKLLTLLLLSLGLGAAHGQNKYSPDYYIHPLDGPILLSANFGEMRPNHFHSGADIKTGGVEGKPLKSVADGYIARVGIAPWGYGRTLYIAHPNGSTSVYAHMQRFNDDIEVYVADERYRQKKHYGDFYPPKDKFVFKQGDQIGLSGNSGMSFGPHLHFEIRDESQRTLNTIAGGFVRIKDDIKPTIAKLYYLEVDTVRGVPVHSEPRAIAIKHAGGGNYTLESQAPLKVGARGYFVVEVTDRKNDTHNSFGIYRISQRVDGDVNFEFSIDRLMFSNTRYVNSMSVYPMQRSSKNEVVRLALQEGNYLPMYRNVKNRGVIVPPDKGTSEVVIEVEDDSRNISTLSFEIVKDSAQTPLYADEQTRGEIIEASKAFIGGKDGLTVNIPAFMLYESAFFTHEVTTNAAAPKAESQHNIKVLSDTHTILSADVPLHGYITVSIDADISYDMRAHACLASVSKTGAYSYVGGGYKDDKVTARTRTLGGFAIVSDNVAPTAVPTFKSGADLSAAKSIAFTLKDNFSGIEEFSGSIDGKWILFEYDARKSTITHYFDDERTPRGKEHQLELRLKDGCGNQRIYQATFIR